jgi:hypothetical protein
MRRSEEIRPAICQEDKAMTITTSVSRFPIGQLVITPGAWGELTQDDVIRGLVRHMGGDWGELDEFDWKQNECAVENGGRLLSRYVARSGEVFWIITEHDRSVTTILMPIEY